MFFIKKNFNNYLLPISKFNLKKNIISTINKNNYFFVFNYFFVLKNFFFYYNNFFKNYIFKNFNFFILYTKIFSSLFLNNFFFIINYYFFKFNIFMINLNKNQPYFILFDQFFKLKQSYSAGYIFRLFGLRKKSLRRQQSRYLMLLSFLKKFYYNFFNDNLHIILVGFKKKYENLIFNGFFKFLKKKPIKFFFITKALFNIFLFRRVKSIKKRIKKSIWRH